jgi:hypothetical protein
MVNCLNRLRQVVLRIRIWDPVLFDPWIQNPDPRRKSQILFLRTKYKFFGLNILRSGSRIRDLINPGSGWQKFGPGIRDKYPGSATLETGH